jgi:DNA invertase Pin-like site-specific DNA recombinase
MSEPGKVTASHLSRAAVIYVRQSTLIQVERNTESTARQYDLVNRARQLGWPREAVRVVDGDLGVSGSVTGQRDGFEGVVAEVALGQVGIILALEVSRLARDNALFRYRNKAFCSAHGFMPHRAAPPLAGAASAAVGSA